MCVCVWKCFMCYPHIKRAKRSESKTKKPTTTTTIRTEEKKEMEKRRQLNEK